MRSSVRSRLAPPAFARQSDEGCRAEAQSGGGGLNCHELRLAKPRDRGNHEFSPGPLWILREFDIVNEGSSRREDLPVFTPALEGGPEKTSMSGKDKNKAHV